MERIKTTRVSDIGPARKYRFTPAKKRPEEDDLRNEGVVDWNDSRLV
jgi:hypothetical protein